MDEYKGYAFILVAVCVLASLFYFYFPEEADRFALNSSELFRRPYTLVTYILLHDGAVHLFYNMFALAIFGSYLERLVGSKKFLLIFLSAGILSGFVSSLFYDSVIGASGAVYGIVAVLAVLRPWSFAFAMGVPVNLLFAIFLWASIDFIGLFTADDVAHIGHLSGLFFGLVVGFAIREKYKPKRGKKIKLNDRKLREWEEKYLRP